MSMEQFMQFGRGFGGISRFLHSWRNWQWYTDQKAEFAREMQQNSLWQLIGIASEICNIEIKQILITLLLAESKRFGSAGLNCNCPAYGENLAVQSS